MLYQKNELLNCLFFDAETIPKENSLEELKKKNNHLYEIWMEKFHIKNLEREIKLRKEKIYLDNLNSDLPIAKYLSPDHVPYDTLITPEEIFIQYAPLQAEFLKVFCISVGIFNEDFSIEIETVQSDNEKELLQQFKEFLDSDNFRNYILAGYNIKGFDIPVITKRFLIHNLSLPRLFRLKGKKPWEINICDLMDDWKGIALQGTSLDLVCTVLNVPTPKDDFKNSEVVKLLLTGKITPEQVCKYCEKDVVANMNSCLKLSF